ncbi:MAG: response regulator [Desulfuromonadaceae bacterium]|nr:response regulator [Desulfuromonadaceae bacterium]MDD5105546.1 response regulator [Desulfuromonadaceae bacterium]
MNNTILLVDDEDNVLTAITRALFDEPLEIVTSSSAEQALEVMKGQSFKVVISDERMIGMQGSDFLAQVRSLYPETIRIMLTGHATLEAAMKAVNEGEIYRFFAKPWNDHDLKFAIRSALEKFDLEAENRRLLATVKSQAVELKSLEKFYPGISDVERDNCGSLVLQELSDNEMQELFSECEQKYGVNLTGS